MHVIELAREARVPDHVIRYDTQVGFLKSVRDSKNRYRDYAASDVYRVRFIRRSKPLGFTLRDVKAILLDAERGLESRTFELPNRRDWQRGRPLDLSVRYRL